MSDSPAKYARFDSPAEYQICVAGRINPAWSDRLGGMSIRWTLTNDNSPATSLVGKLRDQAALAGVLNSLYELHLVVLSVENLGS
jgi:hypothetical protein